MGGGRGGDAPTPQSAFRPAGLSQNQHPRWPHRQEYRGCPAGGIPECSRGGAVCGRIQLGMIPIGLNSIATISIFGFAGGGNNMTKGELRAAISRGYREMWELTKVKCLAINAPA